MGIKSSLCVRYKSHEYDLKSTLAVWNETNYVFDTFLAILIRATLPITLQVASVNDLSSDAYLALPRSNLGTEYYVMSYIHRGETRYRQGPSQFAIIGSEDGTEVEILGDVLQNFLYVGEFETYQVHIWVQSKRLFLFLYLDVDLDRFIFISEKKNNQRDNTLQEHLPWLPVFQTKVKIILLNIQLHQQMFPITNLVS